jgi:hypothetical protein
LQLLIVAVLAMAGFVSCKRSDGYNVAPVSTDKTKPAIVTNIKVDDYNGGSYITYDLPNSDNILYVLARYSIRDKVIRETKSSYYTDTVKVEGFAKEGEYDVTLYTVTRANVMSDPITVKVHPQTPNYLTVRPTVTISADFGGIKIRALNPLKKEIGLVLVGYDSVTHAVEIQDQHYAKLDTIDYSLRGYPAVAKDFSVYVTDKYGNISDTLTVNLTPLYEELLDKSKFSAYTLPSDDPIGFGWVLPNLWNGKTDNGSAGWHTEPNSTFPITCSFDTGRSYQLSRFVIWERTDIYTYGHGNPRDFTLWGSNVASPKDAALPVNSAVGTKVGDWTNLGNFHYPPPPSGTPIPGNSADQAFVAAGVNFDMPFNTPVVRFIRVGIQKTWGNAAFGHIMELSFYGKPE